MQYSEQQKFEHNWIKLVLWCIVILCAIISIIVIAKAKANFIIALLPFIFNVLLLSLFSQMKLELTINENMLRFKFRPFINRIITKDKIRQIQIINYDPISEYGGWGIRYGKNGWAYTAKGFYGIKLITSLNKKILIGISNPEAISKFLKEYYPTVFNDEAAEIV